MCCKRYHIIFSTFSLNFNWQFWKKLHFGHVTSYELTHFKKMVRVWKTKSLLFCLRYDPLIVFRRQNHMTFIFIKTMSHDLLVQMAYSIVSHQLRYKVCSINVSVFLMSFFNVVIGSNGPQKFCIEKVGKETWLPRSHTWQVSSNSVNSSRISSVWFCYKHLTISHALIDWELRTMRE